LNPTVFVISEKTDC